MEKKMVDVTLHLDENLSHDQREALRDAILVQDGVMAASTHDEKPHLMIVEYDPDTVNSSSFLEIAKAKGIHAELIGL
jgi:hypothetical protein